MVSVVGIAYSISMIDRFSRNFTRLINFTENLSETSLKLSDAQKRASLAIIGTAGALDAALALTALRASKVEDALARLETVTRSATQSISSSLSNAREAARRFSTEYTASVSETIRAQFELATAGVAVEEQVAAVQASFKLARATVQDFTSATQFMGQLLNTFGQSVQFTFLDPFEKARRITDTLSATVQRFQVTLPVLQEGFKFLVGPATQLGLKLEDVATALGILNTAGFRGTLGGTALSNVFNKLQRAIDKLDLDPEKFTDAQGNISELADFFREVGRAVEDLSPIERQLKLIEVFDIRAGRVVPTLINLQDHLRKTAAEISLMNGITEQMANTVEETTSSQLKKLVNTFDNIAASVGEGVNNALKIGIGGFRRFTSQLQAFVESNKTVIVVVAGLAAGIATLSTLIIASTAGIAALSALMVKLSLTSTAAVLAVKTLGVAIAALAGVAATVFVVPLLAAFVDTLGSAIFGIETLAEEQDRHARIVAEVERQYGSFSSTLQTVAAEYDRLAKAAEAGVAPLVKGLELGDTALAKFATAQIKAAGAGTKLSTVLSQSGFSEFVDDNVRIAQALGISRDQMFALSRTALNVRQQFDSTFGSQSPTRQFATVFKDIAVAGQIALSELAGGNELLIDTFTKVSQAATRAGTIQARVQEKLIDLNKRRRDIANEFGGGAFSPIDATSGFLENQALIREFGLASDQTAQAVDALAQASTKVASIEGLSQQSLDSLRDFARLTDAGATAVEAFAQIDKSKLQEVLSFITGLNDNLAKQAQAIVGASTQSTLYATRTRELSTALSNLTKNQASFERGITGAEKRTIKYTKNIGAAVVNLKELERQIPAIARELPDLEKRLGADSPFVQGLRNLVREFPEFQVEARIKIRESIFKEDLAKAIQAVRGDIEGLLPFETKNLSRFAGDFANVLTRAIRDANAPQNVVEQFQVLAKTRIVETLSKSIAEGAVIGLRRLPETFQKALGVIAEAQPEILVELRAGNVQRFLEVLNFIKQTLGPIGKQLGIDEFAAGLRKAKESTDGIAKNLADVQTAITTAGVAESAFLREVGAIIQEGQIDQLSLSQLESQISRLQPLIQNATVRGFNTGIAESQLNRVFEQFNILNRSGGNNQNIGIGNLDKIDGLADKLRAAVATVPTAATSFVDKLVGGISRVVQAFTGAQITSATGAGGGRAIQIELAGAAKTFNIEFNKTVTGGGGSSGEDFITEGELREILAAFKEVSDREQSEENRQLEARIRAALPGNR